MLRLVGVTKEEWAKRYDLSLDPRPCANGCGKDLYPEIPFASEDWRGLRSAPHDCGPHFDLKRMAKSTPKGRAEMRLLYLNCKSAMS